MITPSHWFSELWQASPVISHAATTLVFFAVLLCVRLLAERLVQQQQWETERRLKWVGAVRMVDSALLVSGLLYIWSDAVYGVAISIFTIALALVTATKELIMCLHGYIVLLSGNLYRLGDRVEIAGVRGDVIGINMLSTTILEVGRGGHGHQKTGRQICFANSILLTCKVYNESTFENFALLTLSVPLHCTQDWQRAKALLLEAAQTECASFLDHARRRMREVQRRRGIELPSAEPRVNIELPNYEQVTLHLRVPCLLQFRERVEQGILWRFLERMAAEGLERSASTADRMWQYASSLEPATLGSQPNATSGALSSGKGQLPAFLD